MYVEIWGADLWRPGPGQPLDRGLWNVALPREVRSE